MGVKLTVLDGLKAAAEQETKKSPGDDSFNNNIILWKGF